MNTDKMDLKSKDYLHQTQPINLPINHLNINEGGSGTTVKQQHINQWTANELVSQRHAPPTDVIGITTAQQAGTPLYYFRNDLQDKRIKDMVGSFLTDYFKVFRFKVQWTIEIQSHIQHQGMLVLTNSPVSPLVNDIFSKHLQPIPSKTGGVTKVSFLRPPHMFIPLNGNCDTVTFEMPWISNYNSFIYDTMMKKNCQANGYAGLFIFQPLEVGPGVDVLPQIRITRKLVALEHSVYKPVPGK